MFWKQSNAGACLRPKAYPWRGQTAPSGGVSLHALLLPLASAALLAAALPAGAETKTTGKAGSSVIVREVTPPTAGKPKAAGAPTPAKGAAARPAPAAAKAATAAKSPAAVKAAAAAKSPAAAKTPAKAKETAVPKAGVAGSPKETSVVAGATRAAVKTAESKLPARRKPTKEDRLISMAGAPASATMPRVLRTLRINESQVIDFATIRRAAVGNPSVADIAILSGNQLLVNGKTPGETTLFVWDRRGQTRYDLTVVPDDADATAVVDRVRRDVGHPGIAVRAIGETLFLEGKVGSEADAMRAEAIATAYTRNVKNLIVVQTAAQEPRPQRTSEQVIQEMQRALTGIGVTLRPLNERTVIMEGSVTPDVAERIRRVTGVIAGDVQVLDLLAVGQAPRRQVLVRTRVVDINRARTRDLGVDWGRVQFRADAAGTTTATVVDQPFLIGQTDLSPTGLFEGGPLRRLDPIGARISALVRENAARVLSEPNLFVLEGQRGNILIGGEIPIPVSQAAGIGTAISVDWKQFGIQLDVEPISVEGDTVTLRVAPEVSALDFANAVTASGITIPALRSRRAQSVVNIRSGQTIALGGLLQNDIANVVRRIPLLSRIPILGELFKSRTFIRGESELVILVTPEILEPGQAPNVPVPDVELKRPSVGTKELGKESK